MRKIKIRILGSDTTKGQKLKNIIKDTLKTKDYVVELEEINNKYGIKNTPGLIIDDKMISQGVLLNKNQVSKLIDRFAHAS